MLDAIRHAVRTSRLTALTTNPRTGWFDLLISQPPSGSGPDAVQLLCTEIHSALGRIDGVVRCTIGVGPDSTRLLDAAHGLAESAHIADVARSLPPDGK